MITEKNDNLKFIEGLFEYGDSSLYEGPMVNRVQFVIVKG
jgi:hypothetical protein